MPTTQTKIKLLVNDKIVNRLKETIENSTFNKFNDKTKLKVLNKCCELYIYLANTCNTYTFTNIYKEQLIHYRINISKKEYSYGKFIEILDRANIIIINNSYSTAQFPKSYKINHKYVVNEFNNNYTVEFDFKKLLNKYNTKDYYYSKYPEYRTQIDKLYDLEINMSSYIAYLYNNIDTHIKQEVIHNKLVDIVLDLNKAQEYIFEAYKIYFKIFWMKISNEGRLYSSMTNINKIARNFITYHNDKLVELDVKCSQPTLLTTYITHKEFKNDILTKDIYSIIGDSRIEGKNQMYKLLFTEKKITNDKIEKLYPNLIEELNILNKEKFIWKRLQKLESEIFIEELSFYRDVIYTVHDSVFVIESKCDMIINRIKEIYREKFNIDVKIEKNNF